MQRKDKVSRLPLRWRLRVADMLMDGDSYQEVRAGLRALGATDEQLPSDHSLNVFKDTEEFLNLMEQAIERYQLERRAATADAMVESMATVTLGNALKRLDWALSDGELSHREILDTLRGMTQFHALQLATVRERRMWGDTEGEPPALLRRMAGGEPAGQGVPVPYGEMRQAVYPEQPLAESLLDLDALREAAEAEAARKAEEAAKKEAEAAATEAAAKEAAGKEAAGKATAKVKSPETVAADRQLDALLAMTRGLEQASKAHRQLEAMDRRRPAAVAADVPVLASDRVVAAAMPMAASHAGAVAGASNTKETELTRSKPNLGEANRGNAAAAVPAAPDRAPVGAPPRPCAAASATGQPPASRAGGGGGGGPSGNQVPMGGFFGRGRLADPDRAGMVGGAFTPPLMSSRTVGCCYD